MAAEQLKMMRNQIAEIDLLIVLDIERAVILGQTLVEPGRNAGLTRGVVNKQVHILVKNRAVRPFFALLSRQRDVIYFAPWLEIAGD